MVVTLHAFASFVLYVQVGHIYTKRKYFLICIGGPQNEIVRDEVPAAMRLQLQLNLVVQPNEQYQQFDDRHEESHETDIHQETFSEDKHKAKECPICLQELAKDRLVGSLGCQHCFHYDCISHWVLAQPAAGTCPVCRTLIQ